MLSPLLALLGSSSEHSCSPLHHQVSRPMLSWTAPSCASENSPPSWAVLSWQMELGLRLSPSLPTQLGPNRPAEGEWLRHTAAGPWVLLAVAFRPVLGQGMPLGLSELRKTRERFLLHWVVREGYFFFPTGKVLDYPLMGVGGCCSSSVSLFLITVVNMSYV